MSAPPISLRVAATQFRAGDDPVATLACLDRLVGQAALLGAQLVVAPEASPAEQYRWLMLLERHWIGEARGNQVSYTLKIATDRVDLEAFRALLRANQPRLRCCAVLPSRPDRDLGYEYLPEEEVSEDRFRAIVAGIRDPAEAEAVDLARLQCEAGVCPI